MKPIIVVCAVATAAVMGLSACSDASARGAEVIARPDSAGGGDTEGCKDGNNCAPTVAPTPAKAGGGDTDGCKDANNC